MAYPFWFMPRPFRQPHRIRSDRPHTAAQTVETFTSGSGTTSVPAGKVLVMVRLNGGGGGGGGGGNEKDEFGGGGGGGGYVEYMLPTPAPEGTSLAYSVGAGGAEGIAPGNGSAGGNSSVSTYSLLAEGGQGGIGNGGNGGVGGPASGGTTNTSGSTGGDGGENPGSGGVSFGGFGFSGYGGSGGEDDTNGNIGQEGRVSFYYGDLF